MHRDVPTCTVTTEFIEASGGVNIARTTHPRGEQIPVTSFPFVTTIYEGVEAARNSGDPEILRGTRARTSMVSRKYAGHLGGNSPYPVSIVQGCDGRDTRASQRVKRTSRETRRGQTSSNVVN